MHPPAPLPIVTERLVLRAYTLDDVEVFTGIRSDPEVARYQSWSVPFPIERAQSHLASFVEMGGPQPGEWYQVAVTDRTSGELIGDLPVLLHDTFPTAEIGYTFATAWQHRGLATEAVAAFITWLFEQYDLRRVEAMLDPRNLASSRLCERLGFTLEGVKRLAYGPHDDPSDDAIYGLLRTEWPPTSQG